MTGQRWGRLTVLKQSKDRASCGESRWLCRCDCGGSAVVIGSSLRSGHTKSCGCHRRENAARVGRLVCRTHGMSRHLLYRIWCSMKSRCANKNDPAYHNYGGRGIRVCLIWLSSSRFMTWALGHGYRRGLRLERKNNDKGYSPSNCCWATASRQNRNKRNNVILLIDGQRKTVADWCDISRIKSCTVRARLYAGWNPRDAVFNAPWQKQSSTTGDEY